MKERFIVTLVIEEIIRIKNKAMQSMEDKYPFFTKILWKLFANKRYGYQFFDEDGRVLEEYTLITGDNNIRGYETGINNVNLAVAIKESLLVKMLKEIKLTEDYTIEHPFLSTIRYLPRYIFYFFRRDIRFGIIRN